LYVNASRFEGKNIAVQEAQVMGKAIIVSDCSGNRELIKDNVDGLIVNLDKESIAAGIIKLLENKELKSRLERENRKKDFDYSQSLETIYDMMHD
jgi:glycosyltransferase involved in cell wall biosynthesis